MYAKIHIYPDFYTPYWVLINMYPRNTKCKTLSAWWGALKLFHTSYTQMICMVCIIYSQYSS